MIFLLVVSGSESVGSTDMCQTDEAEGTHGQCEILAVKQRRHSGVQVQILFLCSSLLLISVYYI